MVLHRATKKGEDLRREEGSMSVQRLYFEFSDELTEQQKANVLRYMKQSAEKTIRLLEEQGVILQGEVQVGAPAEEIIGKPL